MFMAGVNFSLHYYALTGKPGRYLKNPEFRFYLIFVLVCGMFLTFSVWGSVYDNFLMSLRASFFQAVSIVTTTGFVTADFDLWPNSTRILLVLMMFVGGCAGSTGGGMKVVRVFIMLKKTLKEIRQFMRPQAVMQIKLGKDPVDQGAVANISAFFAIFLLVFAGGSFLMTFFTPDLETATTSVIATLGNIGPGLAAVGASQNFDAIPSGGKALLTLFMLLGRLELYTVLILFLPEFWKR